MFRLANPLWGFALLVKVMTAKRPGLEVVTNFSFQGDKMDGTAHRGKKFQKNSSFNTMTQVILQIHSAVLTSFWGRGGYICTLMHTLNSEWVSAWVKNTHRVAQSCDGHRKELHWDFKENPWLSLCRHEGTLHCRGENKGSILPAVTPMNQDTTEEKKKCLGFFSCCDTQQSWSITQQSTQPLSSLQLHPIMKTTEPSSQPNRDSSSYLAILSSGREKKKRRKK